MPVTMNTTNLAIPAQLARALAQAVAGTSATSGSPTYFAASFSILPDSDASNPYGISGPYAAPTDPIVPPPDPNANYGMFGPFTNSLNGLQSPVQPQYEVTSITLTTTDPGHPTITYNSTDTQTFPDALFLTVEAVANFAAPYYCSVYNPQMAGGLLTTFQQSHLPGMIHLPWSESEEIVPIGQ